MRDVTRIIAGLVIYSVLSGCGKEMPKSKPDYSILPQKVDIPILGKITYITTEALVDLINNGAGLQLVFIQEYEPVSPDLIVPLPGMKTVLVGETVNYVKKLDKSQPLYIICLWGDDSKRMCGELAKEGWNSCYLDGGIYRLSQEIKQGKLRINPQRS